MGCDIHAHIEVKIDSVWHHWDQPRIDRNYVMFAYMANVRNEGGITPISLPRGLPEDCSSMVKFHSDYDGSDGHDHSYLTIEELASLYPAFVSTDRENRLFGYIFGTSYEGWLRFSQDRPYGIDDIRMVFWFKG